MLMKHIARKFNPVKDVCTNLSRVIPLRLYGDGCEATRILSAVWCAMHVQNQHIWNVCFPHAEVAKKLRWPVCCGRLLIAAARWTQEFCSMLKPNMIVLIMLAQGSASAFLLRLFFTILWNIFCVAKVDCIQCYLCTMWWRKDLDFGIFAMELWKLECLAGSCMKFALFLHVVQRSAYRNTCACVREGLTFVKVRTDIHVWIRGGTNLTPKERQWQTKKSFLGMCAS